MNFLFRQFGIQYVNLNSDLDAETLNAQMQEFCNRGFWNFADNLSGRVKPDGYSFIQRWQIGDVTGLGSSFARLHARILPNPNGYGSVIQTKIRPPFGSGIVAVASAFVFLIMILASFGGDTVSWDMFTIGLMLFIIFPVGLAYRSKWAKSSVLNKFTGVFSLYQV